MIPDVFVQWYVCGIVGCCIMTGFFAASLLGGVGFGLEGVTMGHRHGTAGKSPLIVCPVLQHLSATNWRTDGWSVYRRAVSEKG